MPAAERTYSGLLDRLARRVPDAIEDTVLRRAYEMRVAEQVRLNFLGLVLESLFLPLIALAAYLTGYALTLLGVLTPDRLIFVVRMVSLTIFIQVGLRVWKYWDALSLKALREFYREYGLNLVRFVEFQISVEVERQATLQIDSQVRRLGHFERLLYNVFSDGTAHYARVVSRHALEHNRAAVRLILGIASLAAVGYYAVLAFLIAPLVRHQTGESFFRFVLFDPAAAALRLADAHPATLALVCAAGFIVWHKRFLALRLFSPVFKLLTDFLKKRR